MSDGPFDLAFDQFIAGGSAPWLVARKGTGIPARLDSGPSLPPDALDVPILEAAGFPANTIASSHNTEFYQPEFTLPTGDDGAFRFAVTQTGEVDPNGEPFNRATLTLSVRATKPAHLENMPPPVPPVPDLGALPTLIVPVTAEDGTTQKRPVPGTASRASDDTFVLTFELKGSVVEAAYVHLTRSDPTQPDGVVLQIGATYTAYQLTLVNGDPPFLPFSFQLFGDGIKGTVIPVSPLPVGSFTYFLVTAQRSRSVSIGLTFNTDTYRSRFTITAGGATRPIIDADDLNNFAGPRSEYRELTSLGPIQARYPSLRQLYFGQVSATVIAVPAAYGIVRGSGGLAAACDSVVDPSPESTTRCRFHFTFTVAPLADPVDLAQLTTDLGGIPEAVGRTLRLALPPGLDTRQESTLDGFSAGKSGFADGAAAHTVAVSVDIVDDETLPSTTLVNMFLQQLAAKGPPPLFGNLIVRVDDVLPELIRTQVNLNLRQTAGSDELTVAFLDDDDHLDVAVTNAGPFDLALHRFAQVRPSRVDVVSLNDQLLRAGQPTTLARGGSDVTAIAVSRNLVVAPVVTKTQMLGFVRFNTTVVQELQHPLTVNATALDFAAAGISGIEVRITLTDNPGLPIPAMTLTPSHRVDFVHVQIPVDAAVTGLGCTVSLQIGAAAGARSKTITHDFVNEPILVLTPTNTT